jgi:uncharacterized protein YjbJ (UPF0337 family)
VLTTYASAMPALAAAGTARHSARAMLAAFDERSRRERQRATIVALLRASAASTTAILRDRPAFSRAARSLHRGTRRRRPTEKRRPLMNWEQVEGNWKDVKGKLREEWGKLTDQDLERIGGKKDQLVGALKQRYGLEQEKAKQEIDRWLTKAHDAIAPKPGEGVAKDPKAPKVD